jgi:hypothetical protein
MYNIDNSFQFMFYKCIYYLTFNIVINDNKNIVIVMTAVDIVYFAIVFIMFTLKYYTLSIHRCYLFNFNNYIIETFVNASTYFSLVGIPKKKIIKHNV